MVWCSAVDNVSSYNRIITLISTYRFCGQIFVVFFLKKFKTNEVCPKFVYTSLHFESSNSSQDISLISRKCEACSSCGGSPTLLSEEQIAQVI